MKISRILTAAAFAFGMSAANAEEKSPIVIAVAGPMTGLNGAGDGLDMAAGARAAAKAINKKGGVLGRTITIVAADDAGDAGEGVSVANKIAADGIKYVIGHYSSTITAPASAVYDEAGIVHITPSQNPALMQQNFPRFFRINPNAAILSKTYDALVEQAATSTNQPIALIGNHSEFSQNLMASIEERLAKRSIKITLKDSFESGAKDYSVLITKMKHAHIGLVFIVASPAEMGAIVYQSPERGFAPEFALSSTAASSDFAGAAGCAGDGVKVVAARNPLYFPGYEDITKSIRAEKGAGLDIAINTYSSVMAFAQAIVTAGADDPAKVAETLHGQSFDLPIGQIRFTKTGEFVGPDPIVYKYQSVNTPCTHIKMVPATP